MAKRFDSPSVGPLLGRHDLAYPRPSSRTKASPDLVPVQPNYQYQTQTPLRQRKFSADRGPYDIGARLLQFEKKQADQERLNSYIIEQINSLDNRISRPTDVRAGLTDVNVNEILNRMVVMEDQIRADDKIKFELQERLRQLELSYNDLQITAASLNQKDDSDLNIIKATLTEKLTESEIESAKNKEKNQVLFGEVVRIGEQSEQTVTFLKDLALNMENRISEFENRFKIGEQAVDSLKNGISETSSDTRKNNENIGSVSSQMQRVYSDIKNYLEQMQADLTHKNETSVGDLVRKLMQEQDDRIRGLENLKVIVDAKERNAEEKLMAEKSTLRGDITGLSDQVQLEFQRKDETINALQSIIEQQQKSTISALKQEESSRYQDTYEVRSDIMSIYEQIRTELDLFKTQNSSLADKMTETLRSEIDARLHTERDLKNLIQNMVKGVMQEISMLKESQEVFQNQVGFDIKDVQNSFSSKADILSRYIDDSIANTEDDINQQIGKTKEIITALAESVKQNILTNEKWKADFMKGLSSKSGPGSAQAIEDDIFNRVMERMGSITPPQIAQPDKKVYDKLLSKVKAWLETENERVIMRKTQEKFDQFEVNKHRSVLDRIELLETSKLKSIQDRLEHLEVTKQKIITDRLDAAENKLDRLQNDSNQASQALDHLKDLELNLSTQLKNLETRLNSKSVEITEYWNKELYTLEATIASAKDELEWEISGLRAEEDTRNTVVQNDLNRILQEFDTIRKEIYRKDNDSEEKMEEKLEITIQRLCRLESKMILKQAYNVSTRKQDLKRFDEFESRFNNLDNITLNINQSLKVNEGLVSIINGRLDQASEKITILKSKTEAHAKEFEDMEAEHQNHQADIESYLTMQEVLGHVERNEFTNDLNYLLTAITALKDETIGTKNEINELIYRKFCTFQENLAKSQEEFWMNAVNLGNEQARLESMKRKIEKVAISNDEQNPNPILKRQSDES